MGGKFFKTTQPKEDFFHLQRELSRQDKWLNQLHDFSKNLHGYTKYISESNTKHKKEIIKKIDNISQWIEHLNDSHITLKKELSTLKRDIRASLKKDFEEYHKILVQYLEHRLEEVPKHDTLKEDILNELDTPKYEPIINDFEETDVNNITHYNAPTELTNPEKELLSLLFNENKPLTYKNIAQKQNKSVNSIRVYMNSLKSKKGIIDEFKGPNGQKIFTIKNSELVKTLFNF